jgi:branched-chain amino acid transport system ATP-binding protein
MVRSGGLFLDGDDATSWPVVRRITGGMSLVPEGLLAIGQALMSEPRVLLLDEPSAGLSPGMFALVLDVVDELKAQGTAVVLVEQLINDVMHHANRLVILDQGRVVHEGPPGDDKFEVARSIYLSRGAPGAARS